MDVARARGADHRLHAEGSEVAHAVRGCAGDAAHAAGPVGAAACILWRWSCVSLTLCTPVRHDPHARDFAFPDPGSAAAGRCRSRWRSMHWWWLAARVQPPPRRGPGHRRRTDAPIEPGPARWAAAVAGAPACRIFRAPAAQPAPRQRRRHRKLHRRLRRRASAGCRQPRSLCLRHPATPQPRRLADPAAESGTGGGAGPGAGPGAGGGTGGGTGTGYRAGASGPGSGGRRAPGSAAASRDSW